MKRLWKWLRTKRDWYLVCDHPAKEVAFVFGPFKTKEDATNYPNTFRGFVDAPAFRHPITTRVVHRDQKDW